MVMFFPQGDRGGVTAQRFAEAVRTQWPSATLLGPGGIYEATAQIDSERPGFDIHYSDDTLSTDALPEQAARVAVLLRSLYPDGCDVWILADEGSSGRRLPPGIRVDDVFLDWTETALDQIEQRAQPAPRRSEARE